MNYYQPIWRQLGLSISPQDVFLALGSPRNSFLLESVRTHYKTGRYSFVGIEPFLIFKSKGNYIEISHHSPDSCYSMGDIYHQKKTGDPIKELRRIFSQYKSVRIRGLPNFTGGAVGYFSYDAGRLFERLPDKQEDDLRLWDIYLAFFDTIIAFDHFENKILTISNAPINTNGAYHKAVNKIERLMDRINAAKHKVEVNLQGATEGNDNKGIEIESNFSKEGFEEMVMRAKWYIREGDIYQANLSQRLSILINIHPFEIYSVLCKINPSPFACYIEFEDITIAGSSPERLIKLEGDAVQTRPIAGTRPRGNNPEEDLGKYIELILNEKERAEHIMLVDLERNDLGRVCEFGSVFVDELMVLENYSHVIHIVSNINGTLRKDKDRFDLLSACFPGGTITGTPKIRCMELIEELEPVKRGVYTGSIGYLSFNGDMDLNIAIRTLVIKDGRAYIQVGSGIVADSDPTREYYETLYKAEALLEAVRTVSV